MACCVAIPQIQRPSDASTDDPARVAGEISNTERLQPEGPASIFSKSRLRSRSLARRMSTTSALKKGHSNHPVQLSGKYKKALGEVEGPGVDKTLAQSLNPDKENGLEIPSAKICEKSDLKDKVNVKNSGNPQPMCSKQTFEVWNSANDCQLVEEVHSREIPSGSEEGQQLSRRSGSSTRRPKKRASSVEWDCSGSDFSSSSKVPAQKSKRKSRSRKRTQSIDFNDMESDDGSTEDSRRCHVCGATFKKRMILRAHLYRHLQVPKPFPCDHEGCSKSYTLRQHLERHKSRSHSDLTISLSIQCPAEGCHKIYASMCGLKNHINKFHSSEGLKFPCPQCEKKFAKQKQLRHHIAEHTGEPPIKCSVCGAGAYSDRELNRHMRKHKTYKCDVPACDQSFSNYSAFRKHIAEHSRCFHTLRCAHCEKSFKSKFALRQHVLTHLKDNEKEIFKCPIESCPRFYYRKRSLDCHIRTKHEKRSNFMCTWTGCDKFFLTQKRLNYHLHIHENGKKKAVKKEGPKKRRKDAGVPKRAMASKLAGLCVPLSEEKALLEREPENHPLELEDNVLKSDALIQTVLDHVALNEVEQIETFSSHIAIDDPKEVNGEPGGFQCEKKSSETCKGVEGPHCSSEFMFDERNDLSPKINELDQLYSSKSSPSEAIKLLRNNRTEDVLCDRDLRKETDNQVLTPVLLEKEVKNYVGKIFEVSKDGSLMEVESTGLSENNVIESCTGFLSRNNSTTHTTMQQKDSDQMIPVTEEALSIKITERVPLVEGIPDSQPQTSIVIPNKLNNSSPNLETVGTVEDVDVPIATLYAETIIDGPCNTGVEYLVLIPKNSVPKSTDDNTKNAILGMLSGDIDVYKIAEDSTKVLQAKEQGTCGDTLQKVSIEEPTVVGILQPLVHNLSNASNHCIEESCHNTFLSVKESNEASVNNNVLLKSSPKHQVKSITQETENMVISKLAGIFNYPLSCASVKSSTVKAWKTVRSNLQGPSKDSVESDASSNSGSNESHSDDSGSEDAEDFGADDDDNGIEDGASDGNDGDGEDDDDEGEEDDVVDIDEISEEDEDDDENDENGNNQGAEQLNGPNDDNNNGNDNNPDYHDSDRQADPGSSEEENNQEYKSGMGVDRALSLRENDGQVSIVSSSCGDIKEQSMRENQLCFSNKICASYALNATMNEAETELKEDDHCANHETSRTSSPSLMPESTSKSVSSPSPNKKIPPRRRSLRLKTMEMANKKELTASAILVERVLGKCQIEESKLKKKNKLSFPSDSSDSEPHQPKKRRIYNISDDSDDSKKKSQECGGVKPTNSVKRKLKVIPISTKACCQLPADVWLNVLRLAIQKHKLTPAV